MGKLTDEQYEKRYGRPRAAAQKPPVVEDQPELMRQFEEEQAAEQGMVPIGIPQSRHFRRATAARAVKVVRGKVVDRRPPIHDSLPGEPEAAGYRVLHPTKGWRVYTRARLARIEGVESLLKGWGNIAAAIERTLDTGRLAKRRRFPSAPEPRTARQLVREIASPDVVSRQQRRYAARKGLPCPTSA